MIRIRLFGTTEVWDLGRSAVITDFRGIKERQILAILALYAALGSVLVITLRAMARRWRAADEQDSDVPYGPSPGVPRAAPLEVPR